MSSPAVDEASAAATVSVVIVAFRSDAHLMRCLQHLAVQSHPPLEVLVVDNDGPDSRTPDVVAASPVPVRLISPGCNLGFAAANNRAASLATGRWLALLNPDAFPAPDWLAQLVAGAEAAGAALAGSTQLDDGEPTRFDGAGDVWHGFGLAWRAGYGHPVRSLPDVYHCFGPCGAAALYRREVFLTLGGFEERFFCYAEDVEFAFRARLAGHRAVQVAAAVVRHVGSASTGLRSDFALYHGIRNLTWTVAKCLPARLWWTIPLHLALQVAQVLLAAKRGHGRAALRGLWHGVIGVPGMLRLRRSLDRTGEAAVPSAMEWRVSALWQRGAPACAANSH
ncbi:MAG: glycosyltransferase family 2 protein [Alphaproteobacteria bacterium]|nr:MAG: glycosyltransferase family 2 protein [Alphaproteobacteria bacterium]